MAKERIDDIIKMGHSSIHCTEASAFEVELAKLITACIIMPDMEVGYEFVKENDEIYLIFHTTLCDGRGIKDNKISLDHKDKRSRDLCITINNIRNEMLKRWILLRENNMSKNDDIFWTALDNAVDRIMDCSESTEVFLSRIKESELKLNTFRKLLDCQDPLKFSRHESLFASVLACIGYYTNSNNPDNELSRLKVKGKTYFSYLDDFDCINRAIRDNSYVRRDMDFNDYICARTALDDKKANYLAGLYQKDFTTRPTFSSRDINIFMADFLDNATLES